MDGQLEDSIKCKACMRICPFTHIILILHLLCPYERKIIFARKHFYKASSKNIAFKKEIADDYFGYQR